MVWNAKGPRDTVLRIEQSPLTLIDKAGRLRVYVGRPAFGPEVGAHARSSVGMVMPLNTPVNCEAEVEIHAV